jgi:TrmH family RNA methyltransferase
VVVLDGLEIPGNIGTIIRTSDGAAVDAVFICNRRARIAHPKVIRAAWRGLYDPVVEFADGEACSAWLRDQGFSVYWPTPGLKKPITTRLPGRCALNHGQRALRHHQTVVYR